MYLETIIKKFATFGAITLGVLTALALFATAIPAYAETPIGCDSDQSGVNIITDKLIAVEGETVTYSVTAGNTGPNGCDIENRSMTLTLPDGTFTVFGPFDYPFPTAESTIGSLQYVTDTADLDNNFWTANVSWNGTLKAAGDLPSSGSKNISVSPVLPLEISKTAVPATEVGYRWEIDKSVTPAVWDLLTGDSGTSEYTIDLEKIEVATEHTVEGVITITNPNANFSTTIDSVSDVISGYGNADSLVCDETLPFVLGAGETLECDYTSTLPDTTTRTNTVTVETTGTVPGGDGEATIDFTNVVPTETGSEIDVDDTFDAGDMSDISESTSYTYERTFVCDTDEGENPNTATIVQTEQSDDALVTVNCSSPSIDIEKATNGMDADTPTGPIVAVGDMVNWTYEVTNDGDVDLTGVVVTDDQGVTVTCPQDTLAVGESMTCTASGVATEGQYANIGSVDGYYVETLVEASDPSHYFGEMQEVQYCSPGYWKQSQHFQNWNEYEPTDTFSSVFGETITIKWSEKGKPGNVTDPTLLQALQANGGGINVLARASVGALLNASILETEMTTAEVISAFQDVYPGTNSEYQALVEIFTAEHNCPLGSGVYTPPTPPVPLLGALAPEDFGVVEYEVSDELGTLAGYTAGFGLSDATLAGATSIMVKLYAEGNVLLQTNTAILPAFNADITGTQFSSPFDVSGDFDYEADGYWTNVREAEYGQSVPAVKVVAMVTLANTKVVTATNMTLSGDPTTIYPDVVAGPEWDTAGSYVVAFNYLGSDYAHDMTLAQDGLGNLTGSGGNPAGDTHAYGWTIDGGSTIVGNTIHLNTSYILGALCSMTIDGIIASPAGTMSGTWSDNCDGARAGTWSTTNGTAVALP